MKLQKLALVIAVSAASPAFAAVADIATLVGKFVATPTPAVGNYTNIAVNEAALNSAVVIGQDTFANFPGGGTIANQTPIALSVGSLGTNPLSEINTNGLGAGNTGNVEAAFKVLTPLVTGTNGGVSSFNSDQSVAGNTATVGGISSTIGNQTKKLDASTSNGSLNFNSVTGALTVTAGTTATVATPSSLAGTSLTNLAYNVAAVNTNVGISGVGSVAVNNLKIGTNVTGAVNTGAIKVTGI